MGPPLLSVHACTDGEEDPLSLHHTYPSLQRQHNVSNGQRAVAYQLVRGQGTDKFPPVREPPNGERGEPVAQTFEPCVDKACMHGERRGRSLLPLPFSLYMRVQRGRGPPPPSPRKPKP